VFEIKSVSDTMLPGQSLEAMAMHYDGMFKKKHADSTELGDVWLYQLFHCLEAYPTNEQQQQENANEDLRQGTSGRTLFTHTAPLLDDLTEQERERLRKTTLVYNTGLFDQAHLTHASPVVITHPVTGHEVLRYHEPWGPERTKMFTTTVTTQGVDTAKVLSGEIKDETADWVASLLVDKLYDPKYCYAHAWSKGEFVIADNVSLIHARTAMKADGRHVRRIHIN
jgi:alpha-ketoglutarate-dependent taurine dioxygenase